jgi:tRNA pseudouridine55 synthase
MSSGGCSSCFRQSWPASVRTVPDGILNLDKPRGPTSHDIVGHVRRLTGVRRVGHTGTLDPMATGVLVLCLGKATRVVEYLMASRKVYTARVRLGESTDTYDAEGEIVERAQVTVDRAQVEAALAPFRGSIMQAPPMFSAVKRGGVPLYRLARQGIEVEREPRPVEVYDLVLQAWEPPEFTLDVTVSAGTYVRTLAHDVGQALGCGGHLAGLTRRACGDFRLADSITIEELRSATSEGRWQDFLVPMAAALAQFPAVRLGPGLAKRLCQGQAIPARVALGRGLHPDSLPPDGPPVVSLNLGDSDTDGAPPLVRVHGPDGGLLALAKLDHESNALRPHKVFYTPRDNQCA